MAWLLEEEEGLNVLLGPVVKFLVKFRDLGTVLGLSDAENWNGKPQEPECLKG